MIDNMVVLLGRTSVVVFILIVFYLVAGLIWPRHPIFKTKFYRKFLRYFGKVNAYSHQGEHSDLIERITREFDKLFPDNGKSEAIESIKDQCVALALCTAGNWNYLPTELKTRIVAVEREPNRREIPIAFHIVPWFTETDIEVFDGV
jgi:hypothetical protein